MTASQSKDWEVNKLVVEFLGWQFFCDRRRRVPRTIASGQAIESRLHIMMTVSLSSIKRVMLIANPSIEPL
ncbi:MAG: hypothetical protein AAF208_13330 [Cyanobacteria bacterium P01_A01_bin.45]